MLAALAEFGYVDGRTVSLELRFADNALERLRALAAELVAAQPDVLYSYTSGGRVEQLPPPLPRSRSSSPQFPSTTMAALVPDTARPGGNITGITINNLPAATRNAFSC